MKRTGIRRASALLAALILILCACAPALAAKDRVYQISEENLDAFAGLLDRMRSAYEDPAAGEGERIDALVERIASVNADDGDIARAVAEHWKAVWLDPDYPLYIYGGDETAKELEEAGLSFSERHAFVVLGYQLKNGKMQDELKGRCQAAAAAARSYPDAFLICSGGATGGNNEKRNTEAGLMKNYLSVRCGIDRKRILTDTRALTTLANAENTFAILRKKDIHSITLVTSTYHQKWGQVLYNAMAALYEKSYGFRVTIAGNYCYDTEPENERLLSSQGIALAQLSEMLKLGKGKQ